MKKYIISCLFLLTLILKINGQNNDNVRFISNEEKSFIDSLLKEKYVIHEYLVDSIFIGDQYIDKSTKLNTHFIDLQSTSKIYISYNYIHLFNDEKRTNSFKGRKTATFNKVTVYEIFEFNEYDMETVKVIIKDNNIIFNFPKVKLRIKYK